MSSLSVEAPEFVPLGNGAAPQGSRSLRRHRVFREAERSTCWTTSKPCMHCGRHLPVLSLPWAEQQRVALLPSGFNLDSEASSNGSRRVLGGPCGICRAVFGTWTDLSAHVDGCILQRLKMYRSLGRIGLIAGCLATQKSRSYDYGYCQDADHGRGVGVASLLVGETFAHDREVASTYLELPDFPC